MRHFTLKCLNGIKDLVGIRSHHSSNAEFSVRVTLESGLEVFVRSGVEVQPEPPRRSRREVLLNGKIVDVSEDVC